jgi:hypothetical protein
MLNQAELDTGLVVIDQGWFRVAGCQELYIGWFFPYHDAESAATSI